MRVVKGTQLRCYNRYNSEHQWYKSLVGSKLKKSKNSRLKKAPTQRAPTSLGLPQSFLNEISVFRDTTGDEGLFCRTKCYKET
jgi:hypothetical protein